MLEPDRPQIKIWRMRSACWITKATHTRTHTAFPQQKLLHKRTSVLRFSGVGGHVMFYYVKANFVDPEVSA